MTDKEKIQKLEDLMHKVLHSLDMTLYFIENKTEADEVAGDLTTYWREFTEIRHSNETLMEP
jgi:hypothetical protein